MKWSVPKQGYRWRDPVGKKHYKLRTYDLSSLVKHVEQDGILETYDDIPDQVHDSRMQGNSMDVSC